MNEIVSEEDEPLSLVEWSRSEPLPLSTAEIDFLENRVNDERQRIGLEFQRDENVVLRTNQFVGVISLPGGRTIEIQPKAAGGNFLWLIQYARGSSTETINQRTELLEGRAFLDAIAALYLEELKLIVRRGLHRSYRRKQEAERFLRGQLQPQRQLQRQGIGGTRIECTYDELTYDTTTNRSVLFATNLLKRLTRTSDLRQSLETYESLLRKRVELTHVRPADLHEIQTSRLNDYYADILQLVELIIRHVYIENLMAGTRGTFSLLLNMNRIFEQAVERAASEAAAEIEDMTSYGQMKIQGLVSGGKFKLNLQPDFLVEDSSGRVKLVGDAKWKLGRPHQPDQYQLAAYQLANEAPGILVYPAQEGDVETEYTLQERYKMRLVELPTADNHDSFEQFGSSIRSTMREIFKELIVADSTNQ